MLASDNWGGTEVQVATQILRGDAAACDEAVAVLEPPGVLHEHLRENGVAGVSLAGRGGGPGMLLRLARLLRRGRFDVVEAYGFKAGLLSRAATGLVGGPRVLIGVRGLHFTEAEDPDGAKTRFVLGVERQLARWTHGYDANSCGARDFLVGRGFPAKKFTVIPNGVDLPARSRVARRGDEPVRLISVARFVPRKRHTVLIKALERLRDAGLGVNCELVGYGPTEPEVRRLADASELNGHLDFAGRLGQPEIAARLAQADIFVLNSLWEGMPGSILEAMAAGLPVVATDVSGTNEVVVNGETGLLVPPDDPGALADAIATLVRDGALRLSMGAAARRRAETQFSFERVVLEKAALYRRVAAET